MSHVVFHQALNTYTPMAMEHLPFEDVFPIEIRDFPNVILVFRGVIPSALPRELLSPKTHMEPENGPLEVWRFLLETIRFSGSMLVFGGVTHISDPAGEGNGTSSTTKSQAW